MKFRFASFALMIAVALAAPAAASTLYSNGPINGTIDGYNICCIFTVSDSFTLSANSTVTGFDGGFWVRPGDSPVSASWNITLGAPSYLGGTILAAGSGTFSNSLYCLGCGLGFFDIYTSTMSGMNVALGPGTYYLELFNGLTAVSANQEFHWDQNFGPSTAYEYPYYTDGIGSQAFNLYGTTSTSTPEPGTLMLLGSGVAGLAGLLRRKINS
jgi:PEP-CTERM motif